MGLGGLETAHWYNKLPFKTNRACFVQKPARETCLQDFRRDSPHLPFDPRPKQIFLLAARLAFKLYRQFSWKNLSLSLLSPCFFFFSSFDLIVQRNYFLRLKRTTGLLRYDRGICKLIPSLFESLIRAR